MIIEPAHAKRYQMAIFWLTSFFYTKSCSALSEFQQKKSEFSSGYWDTAVFCTTMVAVTGLGAVRNYRCFFTIRNRYGSGWVGQPSRGLKKYRKPHRSSSQLFSLTRWLRPLSLRSIDQVARCEREMTSKFSWKQWRIELYLCVCVCVRACVRARVCCNAHMYIQTERVLWECTFSIFTSRWGVGGSKKVCTVFRIVKNTGNSGQTLSLKTLMQFSQYSLGQWNWPPDAADQTCIKRIKLAFRRVFQRNPPAIQVNQTRIKWRQSVNFTVLSCVWPDTNWYLFTWGRLSYNLQRGF